MDARAGTRDTETSRFAFAPADYADIVGAARSRWRGGLGSFETILYTPLKLSQLHATLVELFDWRSAQTGTTTRPARRAAAPRERPCASYWPKTTRLARSS